MKIKEKTKKKSVRI